MPEAKCDAKPLALLIPGLDGTGMLYYRQLEALSVHYRVLPWRFRPRADFDLCDLTRELGEGTAGEPPGSVLVVGESFGGLIALDYVLSYPERVRLLVLVNAFPYYRPRLRIRLARALARLLEYGIAQRAKNCIVDRTLLAEGIPEEDRRRYHEIVRQVDPAAYRRRLAVAQKADLRPRLANITVPTLLIASGRDKIVPSVAEAHFMAARIPCARVREYPKAGHALLLTPGVSLADHVSWKSEDLLPPGPGDTKAAGSVD
jgi:pimeloyl-ACP methyl ester carboxylesterase